MSIKRRVQAIREEATMEHALLLAFILPSIYMFVEAFEFSSAAQQFPQFTTGMVIFLGVLLLFRQYLPEPLGRLVTDEVDVLETGGEEIEQAEELAMEESGVDRTDDVENEQEVAYGAAVLGAMCIGYMVLSFLIGMLWATPLFVLAYTWWRDQSPYAMAGLTVLSFAIAFAFFEVIGLPIEEGYIQGVLGL